MRYTDGRRGYFCCGHAPEPPNQQGRAVLNSLQKIASHALRSVLIPKKSTKSEKRKDEVSATEMIPAPIRAAFSETLTCSNSSVDTDLWTLPAHFRIVYTSGRVHQSRPATIGFTTPLRPM